MIQGNATPHDKTLVNYLSLGNTTMVSFVVVDYPSAYNTISRQSTLNKIRVVTSTYHLKMKFPMEHGVREVKGDQVTTRR